MLHSIPDYGLTPQELEAKHEKAGEHPYYTMQVYRDVSTVHSYWEWVQRMLQSEEDQLAEDSPFKVE